MVQAAHTGASAERDLNRKVTRAVAPGRSRTLAALGLVSVAVIAILAGLLVAGRRGTDPMRVIVPDLSGSTVTEAREILVHSSLRLGLVGERGLRSGPPLLVIEQSPPAGLEVAERTTVDVVVARHGDPNASDVTNWEFQLPSRVEITTVLAEFGFDEVALLDISPPPRRLLVWEAAGHFHARTDYGRVGQEISLLQADEESELQGGEVIDFRGAETAYRRDDGTVCWLERSYSLCLTPGEKTYGRRLEWVESSFDAETRPRTTLG